MGKSSDAPTPPDPYDTAAAQTKQNKETALWNASLARGDEYTPLGSRTWTRTDPGKVYNYDAYKAAMDSYNTAVGGQRSDPRYMDDQGNYVGGTLEAPSLESFASQSDPEYRSDITLSPEMQRLFDQSNRISESQGTMAEGLLGRVGEAYKNPLDYSSLGAMPGADDAARQRIEDALMARQEPLWNKQEDQLRTRLYNQGFKQGDEGWNSDLDTLNRSRNDARLASIMQAGQEQSRLFNLGMQGRQQGIQEMNQLRNMPLNELNALRGGAQLNMPQFSPVGGTEMAPTDISGNIYKNYAGQQDVYNQQVASQNATQSGLYGLGSAALMASNPWGWAALGAGALAKR